MTQNERVLARLEQHGEVNTTDFLAPRVCDGGAPIIRLAARILDLREQGHPIEKVMEPNGTATYFLGVERSTDGRQDPVSVPLDIPLFEQPAAAGNAIRGWD